MTSYVLQDKKTKMFLEKTDAWGYTFTDDLQRARVYVTIHAARRTATNTPAYFTEVRPEFDIKQVKITLVEEHG